MGDRAGAEGIAREGRGDRRGKRLRPVVVEQGQEAPGVWAPGLAACREALDGGGGGRDAEPVPPGGVDVGLVRGGEPALEMRGVVEGLPRVVAAPMAGQFGLAVQEPDGGRAGHEREGAPHVRVGNRVLIPIEADVGRLAGAHRAQDVGLKRVRRQGEQPGLFLRQHVADRSVPVLGMAPLMGDVVPPAAKLRVEVVEVAKGPGRKERVPEVLDLALDFPLLIAAGRRTGPGRKVIVPRELAQAGMKLNRRAPPIKHSAAEIVVDQGPGTPAQRLEGGDVSAEEALERLVQREEREEGARVAEDHHEAGDRAHAVADADRAKRTPVDLCLLAHQGDHAAIDVRGRLGPQAPHQSADLYGRPAG